MLGVAPLFAALLHPGVGRRHGQRGLGEDPGHVRQPVRAQFVGREGPVEVDADHAAADSLPGEPLFPALTDDSILKPQLAWTLAADRPAHFDAETSSTLMSRVTYNAQQVSPIITTATITIVADTKSGNKKWAPGPLLLLLIL